MARAETTGAVVETATSLRGWADVIRERFIPLQIAQRDASDLAGSVRSRQIGHLQASIVDSVPQTFTRTRRLISAGDHELLALGVVERGTGYLEQDGRSCVVCGGDFALYDTARPFTWSLTGDWRLRVYTWPRETITLTEPDSQQLTATAVPGNAGVGRFLSPMLARLARTDAGLSPAGSIRLAGEVAELSVIATLEAGRGVEHARSDREQLRKIQAFIEQNLADPALTPACIAQEFYISARTLHRLFARHGLTVAAWIKNRRLEACRRALVSPGSQTVPSMKSHPGSASPIKPSSAGSSPSTTARARASIGSVTEADQSRPRHCLSNDTSPACSSGSACVTGSEPSLSPCESGLIRPGTAQTSRMEPSLLDAFGALVASRAGLM